MDGELLNSNMTDGLLIPPVTSSVPLVTPAIESFQMDFTSWLQGPRSGPAVLEAPVDHSALFSTISDEAQRYIRAKDNEVAHLRRTVQELGRRLHEALTSIDKRNDDSAALQRLQISQTETAHLCAAEVREARLEMMENRVRYRSKEEELASTYNNDVHKRAIELLEDHTKEVHEQNFELLRERVLLAEEAEVDRQEHHALQGKASSLRRQLDLAKMDEKELLRRSVKQKDTIKSLRDQVRMAENGLTKLVADYEAKLESNEKRYEKERRILEGERDAARRDAVQLRADLVKLRIAAENLLTQRSELEEFFYDALAEVRQQVIEARRQQLLGTQPCGRGLIHAEHTSSSVMRLEHQGQLFLTDNTLTAGAMAALRSSANERWTSDARGLPKRITNQPRKKPKSPRKVLPPLPRKEPPSLTTTAEEGDERWDGTLVTSTQLVPPYLAPSPPASREIAIQSNEQLTSAARETSATSRASTSHSSCSSSALAPPLSEMTGSAPEQLRSIPNAPTWKTIQKVDIRDLEWADKERVIRLLFRRIQQEGKRAAAAQARMKCRPLSTTTASHEVTLERVAGMEVADSSDTFITQQ